MPDELIVRGALFISHANPEDNAFARWLGAKLTAMGYEVWADVMRLHGGADWSRELEQALRNRAIKMFVVCTPLSMEKQGVRNEIEVASQVAGELTDQEFIAPSDFRHISRTCESHMPSTSISAAAGPMDWLNLLTFSLT